MGETAAAAEAVIISGPRRGEIVELRGDEESWDPEYVALIDRALDELIAAVERLTHEVSAATEVFRRKEKR